MSARMDSKSVWRYIGVASTTFCAISVTVCLYRLTKIDAVLQRVQKSARDMQSDLNDAKERLNRLEASLVEGPNGRRRANMTRSLPVEGGVRSDDEEFYDFSEV